METSNMKHMDYCIANKKLIQITMLEEDSMNSLRKDKIDVSNTI